MVYSLRRQNNPNVCMHQTKELYNKESKLTELKGEIDKFTIIIEDFKTVLSVINRINKHKISKDVELNTIKQLYLTCVEYLTTA